MALTQVQGGMILPSTTLTTPIVATTMGVGGATPATSGSGITFPATQSASTDANTLDDYEEGTWTPGYTPGNGSSTITGQNGTYTKVGRMVCVNFQLQFNVGTSTALGQITGLPFTVSSSGPNYVTSTGREWFSTGNATMYVTNAGATTMALYTYNNSQTISGGVTILAFSGSLTYFI